MYIYLLLFLMLRFIQEVLILETRIKNFIIVDENYKTGFTNLIAKEYINRRKKHSLTSLVLNSDYKQIEDEEIKTIGSIKQNFRIYLT